jgi:hypothetical protein
LKTWPKQLLSYLPLEIVLPHVQTLVNRMKQGPSLQL